MKVVTIGLSPFLMASRAKVNSLIIRYLYLTGNSVATLAWGHATDYFVPEEDDSGNKSFYYDFEYSGKKHKIPLLPFTRGNKDSIAVYEYMMNLNPDLVITVGDTADFPYMHAVKNFYTGDMKWLGVLLHYNNPISDMHKQTIEDMDGILCSSMFGKRAVENLYTGSTLEVHSVGCNPNVYQYTDRDTSDIRIMACPKVNQSDCGPTIMHAVSELVEENPMTLYMHSNIYDTGEHDFESLRNRFDPQNKFIRFPEKYVSLLEGFSETEMAQEYAKSDIFVSIPMISATSMSVHQAIASGCYPIMSDGGANTELAEELALFLGSGFTKEDFLVPSIQVMAAGDTYLDVCGKDDLKNKLLFAYRKIKKHKGLRKLLSEFTQKHSQGSFLEKVAELAKLVLESNTMMCLESI